MKKYEFSSCGIKGIEGPTQEQADTFYYNTNVHVTIIEGIQRWTVPRTGHYIITAAGASGLDACASSKGGLGAVVTTTKRLKEGQNIFILIGQQGTTPNNDWGGTGGGGTFIAIDDETSSDLLVPANKNVKLIIAAAGGGGSGDCDGEANEKIGGDGLCELVSEGGGSFMQQSSSGGSGYKTNAINTNVKSFLNGGKSSISPSAGNGGYSYGGFGGGGYSNDAGGGGGGYKGGDSLEFAARAKGGNSFYDEQFLISCKSGMNNGNGYAIFWLVSSITQIHSFSFLKYHIYFVIMFS